MDGRLFRGLAVLCLALPGLANADTVNTEWYSTTRTRSMGNVGIASADDPETAAFFNPAALARLRKPSLEVFNPQLMFDGGLFAGSSMNFGKNLNNDSVEPIVKDHAGTPSGAGYALFPNVSAQNFSFGALLSGERESYYDPGTASYHHHYRQLFIPTLGLSAGLFGGRIRIGAAARGIQDTERTTVHIDPGSLVKAKDDSTDGFGFGFDAGMILTSTLAGLPSVGLTVRNIGGTKFTSAPIVPMGGTSTVRHAEVPMTVDAGFSFEVKGARKDQTVFAIDYRDLTNQSNAVFQRKINVGTEFGLGRMFFLRLGFAESTWTAGLGLSSKLGSFDIGSYGEELDPRLAHNTLDRQFSFRFTRHF